MNKVGVMQGRLLPKYQNRYQAHPKGYWQEEYLIARELGLDCIEFILDFNDAENNPILCKNGIDEILQISDKTGVKTYTVCADYFMEAPLHSKDKSVARSSLIILDKLLSTSSKLGVTDIVIPCVDQAALSDYKTIKRLIRQIQTILPKAEEKNINLSLETNLAPEPFAELLDHFSTKVTVNYDIGNSAALGYNIVEEITAYGHRITDVHIKDRLFGGSSVILGNGNADFNLLFNKLVEVHYKGPFIMQAFRDDEGIEVFKSQFNTIKKYLSKE